MHLVYLYCAVEGSHPTRGPLVHGGVAEGEYGGQQLSFFLLLGVFLAHDGKQQVVGVQLTATALVLLLQLLSQHLHIHVTSI